MCLNILSTSTSLPLSSNASPSEGTPVLGNIGCTPQSLPKFQHPSHELLKENGFTQHVYHKYRRRCLNGTWLFLLLLFHLLSSNISKYCRIISNCEQILDARNPLCSHCIFINPVHVISLLLTNHREKAAGNRPITGDEHTLPLLVIFPARSLQQEDVRGVQTAGGRGRERRIQVRAPTGDGWITSVYQALRRPLLHNSLPQCVCVCVAGTGWSACSDTTATV